MTQTTKIGDVRTANVCGVELPCVKIKHDEWIIRDAVKYIPGADIKGSTDIFIKEYGE